MKYFVYTVNQLAEGIQEFDHPYLDSRRTQVFVQDNGRNLCTIDVKLSNYLGESVIEDQPVGPGITMPGLLLTYYGINHDLTVENIYVKPEHRGQRIGTIFMKHLFEIGKKAGVKKFSGVADPKTKAIDYWLKFPGFRVPDPNRPLYLELNF